MTQIFLPGGWRRVAAFVVLCVACVGGAILYLLNALDRVNLAGKPMPAPVSAFPPDSKAPSAESGARSPKAEQSVPLPKRADATAPERKLATASSAKNPGPAPSLLFRITSLGETYGQMGQTNLLAPDQLTVVSPLRANACISLLAAAYVLPRSGVCLRPTARLFSTESSNPDISSVSAAFPAERGQIPTDVTPPSPFSRRAILTRTRASPH